jgi:hypothetical protein
MRALIHRLITRGRTSAYGPSGRTLRQKPDILVIMGDEDVSTRQGEVSADIMRQLQHLGAVALATMSLGLAHSMPSFAQQPVLAPRPNILFILADNTGYGDLGAYGGGELRGGADAAHRSARRRGSAVDPVPGRAGLHAIARRIDDRATSSPTRARNTTSGRCTNG